MSEYPILMSGPMVRATLDATKRGYGWDANPWVWVIEYEVGGL